jgi:LytR cell envelope-related transcriptional attenuator
MSPVNFGSARILVIVALVVAGVGILADGFGHGVTTVGATGGTVASTSSSPGSRPSGSTSPTVTAPVTPQAPKDTKIAVFNGTGALGLAAQAQTVLTNAGYAAGQQPANSPVQGGAAKTVVYFRGGANAAQNKADAAAIAATYFKGAPVQVLGPDFSSLVAPAIAVTIVLGQDYATAHGG